MNPIDPEIAKLVPANVIEKVYDDALAPTLKEAGLIGRDLTKVLRLFTAPLQLLATYQDRLADFLARTVAAVPEPDRIPARPEVAGPVLEKLKYLSPNSELEQRFRSLLSSAIDRRFAHTVRLSHVAVLNQLDSGETILLSKLPRNRPLVLSEFGPFRVRVANLAQFLAVQPEEVLLPYLTHLEALGLISWMYMLPTRTRKTVSEFDPHRVEKLYLTTYGETFMNVCWRGTASIKKPRQSSGRASGNK